MYMKLVENTPFSCTYVESLNNLNNIYRIELKLYLHVYLNVLILHSFCKKLFVGLFKRFNSIAVKILIAFMPIDITLNARKCHRDQSVKL